MRALRLPHPTHCLEQQGHDIADPKITDLILPYMADDDPEIRAIMFALRLSFWIGFWRECEQLTDEAEEQFKMARRLASRGFMRIGDAGAEAAERRGRHCCYEWAGPEWRGASYAQGARA
jgi:hypothetical protein